MPFIEGETLHQFCKNTLSKLTASDALDLLEKAKQTFITALKEYHAQGKIFCDINSGNMKIRQQDDGTINVKLIDFGPAVSPGKRPRDYSITPGYAHPDLCDSKGKVQGPARLEHAFYAADRLFQHVEKIVRVSKTPTHNPANPAKRQRVAVKAKPEPVAEDISETLPFRVN